MTPNKIHQKIANLPANPGCYKFLDKKGQILYVGKAKHLKNRIRSYFQIAGKHTPASRRLTAGETGSATPLPTSPRLRGTSDRGELRPNSTLTAAKQMMVRAIADIEIVVTDTETEALLLESVLIKKHLPPYNIVLKDDKNYQFIRIDLGLAWPVIETVRRPKLKKRNPGLKFFGPYTSGTAVKETVRLVKKIFPYCLKPPQKNRRSTPCFNYHLGRCPGVCIGEITPADYKKTFAEIIQFLKGEYRPITSSLKTRMAHASNAKKYEQAAKLRDQLSNLKHIAERQKIIATSNENQDILSVATLGNKSAVNLFVVRGGRVLDKRNFLLSGHEGTSPEELIDAFIKQYYQLSADLPREIITSVKLAIKESELQKLVEKSAGEKLPRVKLTRALRGTKKKMVKLGQTNAEEFLRQSIASYERQTTDDRRLLKNLGKTLNIKPPSRIEAYDVSNIQGNLAIVAMVVFTNGHPDSQAYRKFSTPSRSPDDFAMLENALGRRLKRLKSPLLTKEGTKGRLTGLNTSPQPSPSKGEGDPSFSQTPDLILIDGGKGQLTAGQKALAFHKLKIPIIALAKREEEIFMSNTPRPAKRGTPLDKRGFSSIKLPKNSPELRLLQRIRDEAHRFAIEHYRRSHLQSLTSTRLTDMPGIGPRTASKLIRKFGSSAAVKRASEVDLAKFIGPKIAKLIKEKL